MNLRRRTQARPSRNRLGPRRAAAQLSLAAMKKGPLAPRTIAIFMLLAANMFWGLSFPVVKAIVLADGRLVPSGGGFAVACVVAPRFLVATALLAAWDGLRRAFAPRADAPGPWLTSSELRQGVAIGVFGAVGMLLQNDGLRFTAASTSAFLTQFSAILIPVYLALRDRRNPGTIVWLSCLAVLAGVAVLGRVDWRAFRLGRGEMETLLCSVFFMVQILMLEDPRVAASRPERLTFVWLGFEAVVFGALAFATEPRPGAFFRPWGSPPWLVLTAILAVFCTVAAFRIMTAWQPKITATEAGVIYCLEPVFGAIFALFVPGLVSRWAGIDYPDERTTGNLLLGGGLITAANVLIQLRPRRAPPEGRPA